MTAESLEDIAKENGVNLGVGDAEPVQQAPEQPEPVPLDRMKVLEKPCSMAWGGGCNVAVWLTEVEQLQASTGEQALAGYHLANMLDAIMPEHWLTDLDPNSKAGRILVSGAVLVALVREKSNIYDRVMAEREAEQDEKPEPDAA